MSEIINITEIEELPCEDWKGTAAEIKDCPMKQEWHENEVRLCLQCGCQIGYNCEE